MRCRPSRLEGRPQFACQIPDGVSARPLAGQAPGCAKAAPGRKSMRTSQGVNAASTTASRALRLRPVRCNYALINQRALLPIRCLRGLRLHGRRLSERLISLEGIAMPHPIRSDLFKYRALGNLAAGPGHDWVMASTRRAKCDDERYHEAERAPSSILRRADAAPLLPGAAHAASPHAKAAFPLGPKAVLPDEAKPAFPNPKTARRTDQPPRYASPERRGTGPTRSRPREGEQAP